MESEGSPSFAKRTHDAVGAEAADAKRFRADEIIGTNLDDKVITRLLMTRLEFSKLIGKGGQTIAHIRTQTGVNCRGTNLEDDSRLVLLVGPFHNIMRAFDMITEVLNNGSTMDIGVISVSILLEHSKAGKVVGAKGATIQNIQAKSGCGNIRIEKEPREFSDVQLRKLSLEGTLSAVRRAHYMVHELYQQDALFAANKASGNAYVQGPFTGNQFSPQPTMGMQMMGSSGYSQQAEGSLPFPSLVQFGVQHETVGQLSDMKAYLSRHFGLNLAIFKEGVVMTAPKAQSMVAPYNPPSLEERRTIEETIAARAQKASVYQELCFGVPKHSVGGIIGKSGAVLKNLQTECNVRIHVEKENFGDKRLVVLSAVAGAEAIADDNEKLAAFQKCHQKIQEIVVEQNELHASNQAAAAQMAANQMYAPEGGV